MTLQPSLGIPMVISDSEREDFESAISRRALAVEDFEVLASEDVAPDSGIHPIVGKVTIRHKTTGVEKTYAAGFGTSWPAEFEKDLALGVFE